MKNRNETPKGIRAIDKSRTKTDLCELLKAVEIFPETKLSGLLGEYDELVAILTSTVKKIRNSS